MIRRKTIVNIALTLLLAIHAASILTGWDISLLSALLGAMVLFLCLPFMGKTFRMPAWIFSILGAVLMLVHRAPFSQWVYGLNAMMKTVVILIAVQTLSLAIKTGKYEQSVAKCLGGNIRKERNLFCLLVILAHLLAGVMSLGSVVIILSAIMPTLQGRTENENRFVITAVTIGYCTLFLWAPGTVTVLMSMQVFGLNWTEYFVPAISLAVFGLALGCLYGILRYREKEFSDFSVSREASMDNVSEEADTEGSESGKGNSPGYSEQEGSAVWRQMFELAAVMAVIVAGISILEKAGFSNATGRMIITALAVAGIWLLILKERGCSGNLIDAWRGRLSGSHDLYTFFISMGIFSAGIKYSGFEKIMIDFCSHHMELFQNSVLWIIPVIIIALSLIGIHPFISVLMVGPVFAGMTLPVSSVQLGLCMSLGCCLSYMVSPFAGLILTVSDYLKEPPAKICFRYNLSFALLYYVLAEILLIFVF